MTHPCDRVGGLLWRLRGCHRPVMTPYTLPADRNMQQLAGAGTSAEGRAW
jgi:hypothetical protein